MQNSELVLQLTLKAIEHGHVAFMNYQIDEEGTAESQNAFNAKQISDFMIALNAELFPKTKA